MSLEMAVVLVKRGRGRLRWRPVKGKLPDQRTDGMSVVTGHDVEERFFQAGRLAQRTDLRLQAPQFGLRVPFDRVIIGKDVTQPVEQ